MALLVVMGTRYYHSVKCKIIVQLVSYLVIVGSRVIMILVPVDDYLPFQIHPGGTAQKF